MRLIKQIFAHTQVFYFENKFFKPIGKIMYNKDINRYSYSLNGLLKRKDTLKIIRLRNLYHL